MVGGLFCCYTGKQYDRQVLKTVKHFHLSVDILNEIDIAFLLLTATGQMCS